MGRLPAGTLITLAAKQHGKMAKNKMTFSPVYHTFKDGRQSNITTVRGYFREACLSIVSIVDIF